MRQRKKDKTAGKRTQIFTAKSNALRARQTSITEILRAHSVAQQEAIMQNPAIEFKEWVHTGIYQYKPRQNHVDIDGVIALKSELSKKAGRGEINRENILTNPENRGIIDIDSQSNSYNDLLFDYFVYEENMVNENKIVETLRQSETAIKDLLHEAGNIISQNGKLLHTEIGKKSSVNPPANLIKDNIFTHNHPSGTCAFSLNDIKKIINNNGYEIRTVTSDGRFVSLIRGSDGWDSMIIEDMVKDGLSSIELFKAADSQAKQKYGQDRTRKQVAHTMEEIMNDWLRKNALKYGAIFKEGKV